MAMGQITLPLTIAGTDFIAEIGYESATAENPLGGLGVTFQGLYYDPRLAVKAAFAGTRPDGSSARLEERLEVPHWLQEAILEEHYDRIRELAKEDWDEGKAWSRSR